MSAFGISASSRTIRIYFDLHFDLLWFFDFVDNFAETKNSKILAKIRPFFCLVIHKDFKTSERKNEKKKN